jgi:CO/xanthine dehydrogenase Mo-binding subunit
MFDVEVERYELLAGPLYSFAPDRREFLGLLGGFLVALAPMQAQRGGRAMPEALSAWLHLGADGKVTVFSGKAEVGQNVRTSLAQAVAEELEVPLSGVEMVLGDTARTPYDAGTFGSRSTPAMAPQLRKVAATAREILLDAAVAKLGAREDLQARQGRVVNVKSGVSVAYGELSSGALTRSVRGEVVLKSPHDWKVAGQSATKVNARGIVTGAEKFTSDLVLPGMAHGRVIRPSAFRAKLREVKLDTAREMAGVVAVQDGDFVGVVCDERAQLDSAAKAVIASWDSPAQKSSKDFLEEWKKAGAAVAWQEMPAETEHRSAASYDVAYIAHVPLEPRAAVAEWKGEALTVWTGTQVPFGVKAELARAFGLAEENVRVIVPPTGSGYGGKHSGECAVEAARLAKAAGRPVKLQWTREEEMTWAYFRPAGLIEVRSGARADGKITSWQFHNFNSGGAAIRSPYDVPGQVAEFHAVDSPLRQGSYRGLAATANHFAREGSMDDLAAMAKMDAAAFRLKNASDARLRGVIEAAVEKFGWEKRNKTREGRGFGMMAGFDKGGYVAACVEVSVVKNTIRIERLVASFECGAIVNPEQLKSQVAGGVIMGIGGALFEEIQFANGQVLNPRLSSYRVPRFSDVPKLEIVLVDRKDLPSAGAGETPIVAVAPAVASAVHEATGQRLRSLPLRLT